MTLYDAAIDGIPLEIETLDDQFEVSIARHEFPYKDGAMLENLGQKARVVNIRCYFWDNGEHLTYNRHIELVNSLQAAGLSELTHPQYGVMKGMIERIGVRADDRELTAEVDLTFVEHLRQEISEVEYEDVEAAADQAVIDAQEEEMAAFEDDTREELGAEAADINEQELDPEQGILEQFTEVSRQARAYLKEIDTAVAEFEGMLNDVVLPANSLISTINYGTRLPGRVIGAVGRMVGRYVTLYATVTNAPSRFLRDLDSAITALIGQVTMPLGLKRHVRRAAAIQAGHAVARYYAADEAQRQLLRQAEKHSAFDTIGRYVAPPAAEPVYTVNELEASTYLCRAMLQAALDDGGRAVPSLKTMARLILDHVNTIKLEREKIVGITLDNPLPLHLVCLRYGLDYHYAERLIAINNIPRPNAAEGLLQIYLPPGGAA